MIVERVNSGLARVKAKALRYLHCNGALLAAPPQ